MNTLKTDREKFCVKVNEVQPSRQNSRRREKSERKYFNYGEHSNKNDERVCEQPKIQQHHGNHGSNERLISRCAAAGMEGEPEETLGYEKSVRTEETGEKGMSKNYRNGYSQKSVKTQLGEVELKIPRDRNGEYEPKIIEKYDRNATGMEEKI